MHIHPYFLPVCQERNAFERTVFLIWPFLLRGPCCISYPHPLLYLKACLSWLLPLSSAQSHPFLSLSAAPFQLKMFRKSHPKSLVLRTPLPFFASPAPLFLHFIPSPKLFLSRSPVISPLPVEAVPFLPLLYLSEAVVILTPSLRGKC